ncbi:hypothetical protein SprV_0401440300 [Sparganum proliferum]
MIYLITDGHSQKMLPPLTAVTSILAAATFAKSVTTTIFPTPITNENVPDASSVTTPTSNLSQHARSANEHSA